MEPCRKCGTFNPASNQYCRKCGAVLAVATALVRAQPRTLIPLPRGFRWRWVGLASLVILGTSALSLGAAFSLGLSWRGAVSNGGSIRVFAAVGIALLVAFVGGGWLTSRLSRVRRVAEPALAALVVLVFLAGAGAAVSTDLALVAAALALPCAAAAAFGGWLGALGRNRKEILS